MLKRKQKFDSFNDGVLYYGDYLESMMKIIMLAMKKSFL